MLSSIAPGLALMEVDHRTSAAVKRVLNESFFAQFRREVGSRLITVETFVVYIRLFKRTYRVGLLTLTLDYGVGVIRLVLISGSGAAVSMPGVEQLVPVLLGVPIFSKSSWSRACSLRARAVDASWTAQPLL